ncbi:MAG: response regulator [Chlorobi bacterium]|nr:response regulator [Chlorobiota bacterium]
MRKTVFAFIVSRLLLLGFLFLFTTARAILKFEHFSNREGFNQNTIVDIAQDKYGFLWFGTPNGIIKYDGYGFRNYTHDPLNKNSISNNNIECLYTDDDGNLWIGTREDVNVYVTELDRFFVVPFGNYSVISAIGKGPEGRIWIAGNNAFYSCKMNFEGDSVSFDVSANLGDGTVLGNVSDFTFIEDGSILLSGKTGMYRADVEKTNDSTVYRIKNISSFKTLSEAKIRVIKKAENIFWLGTDRGLFKTVLDGDRLTIIKKYTVITFDKRVIPDLDVLSVFEDKRGVVWVGSVKEGVFRYDSETDNFINYGYDPKNPHGITSPRINSFFHDRFDVLWIGTAQGGIDKLDFNQKQFISYSHNPYDKFSLSGNLITDIMEDSKGRLWVSNFNEAVCRSIESVNDKTVGNLHFENLKQKIPIDKRDIVYTIYEDKKGYVWIGTDLTVVVFNPHTNRFVNVNFARNGEKVNMAQCRVINQIDDEQIILGGTEIVIVKNPWSAVVSSRKPVLEITAMPHEKTDLVNDFLKDSYGNFWIGTRNGLYRFGYDDNGFKLKNRYTTHQPEGLKLSHNFIFSVFEDYSGDIWVGTFGGGLDKLIMKSSGEPLKTEYFRKNNLLPDDAVYGILQEDSDHLWLSTDMGLCRLNIKNNSIELFDLRDGLIQNNFRQSAYLKGKSGYYYFGGLNGLTVFKPENIKLNNILPVPLITGLLLDNKEVGICSNVGGDTILHRSLIETDGIVLNHKMRIVTFRLLVQHYAEPAKNRLAYMLKGFNKEWIETDNGNASITYTNLPAGSYVLSVKGANCDGLWNKQTKDLRIEILPPWYKTWWSYVLFVILALSVIAGVFIYFVQHERLKQRLKYEQKDKKRIDSINQGKLSFFTNVAHEFKTPLTLIAGSLEQIIHINRDKKSEKYLATIQNNTTRLLNLVDQLITFRQAEQKHLNLNLCSDTLGNFIYPAAEAFEDFATQKNINFFYKVNSPNEKVVIDVEKTERIIFNLLSNSFRNTPAHGNISIEADVVEEGGMKSVQIKVIDTGKGIPREKLGKIFERFYQISNGKESVGGTGIGLAFCKSLIDLMGGNINVDSEPGVRTCFTVLIPANDTAEAEATGKTRSFIKDWIPGQSVLMNEPPAGADEISKEHTLLIVEDEPEVRDFLIDAFGGKYEIFIAQNGMEGLNKVNQKEPDLIISDVMMPEMNGFDFCEKIKSNPDTCHIPVILLTALGDNEDIIKGLEFGADDYISKPFSLEHLRVRVEKLIENNIRLKEHFSKSSTIPDKSIEISARDKKFLNEVIEAIERNLSDSGFGVEELAREIGLSSSQFYRRLKQLTGQIPNVYLRNYRLQRAAELLTGNEGLNVTEVMYRIGIESGSYFSTSFKKLYGVSPSEFLRKNNAGNKQE